MDSFFVSDVLLNFRTGYVDANGVEVLAPKECALHYAKTWFCLDFVSCLPFFLQCSSVWTSNHCICAMAWRSHAIDEVASIPASARWRSG